MRLLIVEDNREFAGLLSDALRPAGYAADVALTLVDARAHQDTMHYTATVLDMSLADGNGLELLRKRRAKKDGTPVLALTAPGSLSDRVSGFCAGAGR